MWPSNRRSRWPLPVLPLRQQATSMLATCAPRWWTIWSPKRRAASSFCASMTPTRSGRRKSMSTRSNAIWNGWGWNGTWWSASRCVWTATPKRLTGCVRWAASMRRLKPRPSWTWSARNSWTWASRRSMTAPHWPCRRPKKMPCARSVAMAFGGSSWTTSGLNGPMVFWATFPLMRPRCLIRCWSGLMVRCSTPLPRLWMTPKWVWPMLCVAPTMWPTPRPRSRWSRRWAALFRPLPTIRCWPARRVRRCRSVWALWRSRICANRAWSRWRCSAKWRVWAPLIRWNCGLRWRSWQKALTSTNSARRRPSLMCRTCSRWPGIICRPCRLTRWRMRLLKSACRRIWLNSSGPWPVTTSPCAVTSKAGGPCSAKAQSLRSRMRTKNSLPRQWTAARRPVWRGHLEKLDHGRERGHRPQRQRSVHAAAQGADRSGPRSRHGRCDAAAAGGQGARLTRPQIKETQNPRDLHRGGFSLRPQGEVGGSAP